MSLPVCQQYQAMSFDAANIYNVPYGYEQQDWSYDLSEYVDINNNSLMMDVETAMIPNNDDLQAPRQQAETKTTVKLGRKCLFHPQFSLVLFFSMDFSLTQKIGFLRIFQITNHFFYLLF